VPVALRPDEPGTDPTMARQSNQQEDGQDAAQPRSRIAGAISRLLGIEPNETQDGNSHGTHDGNHDGAQNGAQHGAHNGAQVGAHDGVQDGAHNGNQDGTHDGASADPFRVFRSRDALIDLAPGERPPADAKVHAQALLVWLQADPELAGNWLRRSLLEKLYAGPFLEAVGWPPESWHTVAHHFNKLPGVKWRQKDNRKGSDRVGPSPREYWVPKPKAAVVELAAEKRKRA
jgi:hypothetical protein